LAWSEVQILKVGWPFKWTSNIRSGRLFILITGTIAIVIIISTGYVGP